MALFPIASPKVHSLTGRITPALLHSAFKAVKRNRGAAGIDKVSVKMFEANLAQNLLALERDLKSGSYQPLPLRRKFLDKGGGKFRPLGIPAVRDRVAQEAARRLLTPIFEPLFHEASFGFRPGRNCHQALELILKYHEAGYRVVLDADIVGFFDNLAQRLIKEAVAAQVADGNILNLIEKFLRSGVLEQGVLKPTTVGTPQGGVISPLLANIVLNYLDGQLHKLGYRFVRYADDFVVLCQSLAQAEEAKTQVTHILGQLGLQLSAEKTRLTTYGKGYTFLGFVMSSRSRRMRPKSVQKFQDKVRQMTIRSQNLDAQLIEKLNPVLRGTARYFGPRWSTSRWTLRRLDEWLRRRLRCMKYKRFSYHDNHRMRLKQFERLGLLSLESFCQA
ncbi:MAG TPA: group II intron reverse transcriptase/maturase [Candidatus Methylomirabilis sp.]|nr:group II intron reverse transcriptase/maturase [Candidatus Methylomirabilis sp.]